MKKYERIRKPIVISMAILFHMLLIFHLMFSPVILVAASFKGIINASFIAYGIVFLMSFFFGRAYCSWFCPGCGVQEIVKIFIKKKSKNSWALKIKYFIFLFWLASIVIGYLINGFVKVDVAYGMTNVTLTRKIILTVGAIIIILPLTVLLGQFASCKYVCWQAPFMIIGTKVRDWLHFSGLRLESEPDKCSSCKICDLKCPMNLDVMTNVKNGKLNHTECILCGACIENCKQKVIKFSFNGQKVDHKESL